MVERITQINFIRLEDIGCEYLLGEITYEECLRKMQERMDKEIAEGIEKLKAEIIKSDF